MNTTLFARRLASVATLALELQALPAAARTLALQLIDPAGQAG